MDFRSIFSILTGDLIIFSSTREAEITTSSINSLFSFIPMDIGLSADVIVISCF